MSDENRDIVKAIEGLEQAAEALEEAIDAHSDPATRMNCRKHLPKLREVIESLNEECAPE
jgi:hypothetical protein